MGLSDRLAAVRAAVFDGPGVTDRALRRAAGAGGVVGVWGEYVTAVREASFRVAEADVVALRDGGAGEEEIFEVTVAAAVGAAVERLEAGLRVVAEP